MVDSGMPDGDRSAAHSAGGAGELSVKVDQQVLAGAVVAASKPLPRPSDPLRFAGLWLSVRSDGLQITGTGTSLSIEVGLEAITIGNDAASHVDPELTTVLVPIDIVTQLFRQLPDPLVSLRFNGDSLGVASGRFSADLRLLDKETHEPPRQPVAAHTVLRLQGGRFWDAVSHLAFGGGLVAGSEWSMGSIPLLLNPDGRLQLLATDKDHSAVAEVGVDVVSDGLAGEPVLVPIESVLALDKVLEQAPEVELQIGDSQIDIVAGDTVVRSSVGGPPIPRFEVITDQQPKYRLTTSRTQLIGFIRRLQLIIRSRHDVLWIEWDGQLPAARCVFGEGTQAEMPFPAEVTGAPFEIGIHVRVLASMVQRLHDGTVIIEFEHRNRRATIFSEDEPGFVYYAGLVVVPHVPWR